MHTAHLNRVVTAVPSNDVHRSFVRFARTLLVEPRAQAVFDRMASKAQISHRYSVLPSASDPNEASPDGGRWYRPGESPSTGERMQIYEEHAPALAAEAVDKLGLGDDVRRITHLIVTSCTGMYAPGIDLELVDRCALSPNVERTMIGFMGCYAAINGLKLARHIVRSEPEARVLLVNLELCSLHFQQSTNLEQILSFLVFADGCAASLVTAEPTGFALDRFYATRVPDTRELITWKVRDLGFDMFLSGRVPGAISRGIESAGGAILNGDLPNSVELWAVHPGGRSILDAVEKGFGLTPMALAASRDVLNRFGNMSSATVMFVMESLLRSSTPGQRGCAMSFGPGLTAETMLFHKV